MQETSMQPEIIILRGAPGMGKSSLKEHLKVAFPGGVFIDIDTLREMHFKPDWIDDSKHMLMIECGINLAENMLSEGIASPVFISDTLSKGKVHKAIGYIRRRFVIISLFSTTKELKERLESRSAIYFKDINAAIAINDEVIETELPNEFKIDTTELTSIQLSNKICDAVKSIRILKEKEEGK